MKKNPCEFSGYDGSEYLSMSKKMTKTKTKKNSKSKLKHTLTDAYSIDVKPGDRRFSRRPMRTIK